MAYRPTAYNNGSYVVETETIYYYYRKGKVVSQVCDNIADKNEVNFASFSKTFRTFYPTIERRPSKAIDKAPKKRNRDAAIDDEESATHKNKNSIAVFNSPYKRIKHAASNWDYDAPISLRKSTSFTVKAKEMQAFFKLILLDDIILSFLARDSCRRISDKYLLAMTFAYFKRASFILREYSRMNFFVALYLANDMEEDEEDYKYEIFPWALGRNWRKRYPSFLLKRDKLWKRIGYRAVVSKKCCEEVMAIEPDHNAWKRERPEHHGGAYREYTRGPDIDFYPRGPNRSPHACKLCDDMLEYDSASPGSECTWFVSSGASSESSPGVVCVIPESSFDMHGSIRCKGDDDDIWAKGWEE
ncbi:speedy protein 1-B-like [Tubulanus polymorphus]|uniref:speedy protein 1-B-like n=1 Tax=Tubulanus polymorphus TaxID=672921 RepID=UPI003DA5B692